MMMHKRFIFVLTAGLFAAECLMAQELPALPVAQMVEEEPTDVEVCQDFICTKLREEILVEANKCRPLANFKRRRMRVRRSKANNSCKLYSDNNIKHSKGKCSAAIREACERAGVDARYLNQNAYDLHKKGLMEKAGFVNLVWKYNEQSAPLGAILIYVGGSGHRYGHVEVRVNPSLYCSDFCNERAVSAKASNKYRLVAVYLPFTSSIQMTASNIR